MGKRIYELAQELGVKSEQIIARLLEAGIAIKADAAAHRTVLTKEQEERARQLFSSARPGDKEVTRIDRGRVVRRRVAASSAAPTPAPEAPAPAVAVAETVEPPPAPAESAAAVAIPAVSEEVVTPSAKPEPSADGVATVEPPAVEVAGEPAPRGPEAPPATMVSSRPEAEAKPAGKKAAMPLRSEAPDRQAKVRRQVYDRRRDVISLRDLMTSPDEEPERPQAHRPARRRKSVQRGRKPKPTPITQPKEQKRVIRIEGEVIQVSELAHHMGIKANDLVKKLIGMGVMVGVTQPIDLDTAGIVASDYGFTVEKVGFDPAEFVKEKPDAPDELQPRPPVVTIMGHVDHGKTTLLDRIRKSRVAESEAGGITQHIGAYKVHLPAGDIVFLDTPGHEAFTAMRARGARVTDIVVLVVAADDGVKAQTVEAIAHARDAGAPILVAINKIDKPEANVDRVKKELAEHGLIPEEWGGQNIFCEVSAKKGLGIENLLEMILLQSQVMDLKANPRKAGRGIVVEARLDRQVGPLATVLVQAGTLRVGDVVIAGLAHGRVRRMTDDQGQAIQEAVPVTPVQVSGLDMVPGAGDLFVVLPDEKKAKEVAAWQLEQIKRARTARAATRVSLEDFYKMAQASGTRELKVILRADVQGTLGALLDSLTKLKHPEISLKVIHSAVGNISESDVNLAIASDAVIVGFDVGVDPKAAALADQERVDIRRYSVIYELLEDLRKAMEGLLEPKKVAKLAGKAEVRQIFQVSKVGRIAGVAVTWGRVLRSAEVKVLRGNQVVFEGRLASLKHFKDDVKEVKQGLECGLAIEGFEGVEVGDHLDFYEFETVRETIPVPS